MASVIATFTIIGIIFIPLGLVSLSASEKVVEIVDRYDESCVPSNYSNDKLKFIQNPSINKSCVRTLTVPKLMKSPVFIYYQLDNYYQNHRRYVKSRSDKQLRSVSDEKSTTDCSPEDKTVDAWKSDKEHKFGSNVYPKNFQSGGLIGGAKLNSSVPLSKQEDLMVWMRTAALPTFRKLYGKIEQDLQANEKIQVVIQNNYNTYSFSGKKKLSASYFFMLSSQGELRADGEKPLGDPSYLSWNRSPAGHPN
ncbi:hypothetical protein GOBAR_DD12478 [Gossypium barbadense]|nr:hypothetical protein GOBAR_DD12478 [Gossypium barbadense]